MRDEHSFAFGMDADFISCSTPDCGTPDYLTEDQTFYCSTCSQPFCPVCAERFSHCDICDEKVCENCVVYNYQGDGFICRDCEEV